MSAEQLSLPIDDMAERHPGLSAGTALSYHEAARVCLDRHHHSPLSFSLETPDATTSALVKWDKPDQQCLAAHANEIDATEWGAYCCALATTELLLELVAIIAPQQAQAPTITSTNQEVSMKTLRHQYAWKSLERTKARSCKSERVC